MQIETNQAGIKNHQILSSTMTFSSKNTENNSIEAQSILIEGSHIPRVIDSSRRSSEAPQKSDYQNPRLVYESNHSGSFYKQKSQMSGAPEDGMVYRYKEIERILQGQNMNLKNQNNLFLLEINRLRQTNSKYKKIDRLQRLQLQQLKEECEAERRRADELKEIVMTRMIMLEERMKDGYSLDKSSFLEEMLEFSKDFNQ